MHREYVKGDHVMAKWPGVSKYFPAQVKRQEGKSYEVQFDEGTTATIPSQFIKPVSLFRPRSPSRTRKSPTRLKNSPGVTRRKTSRSRSRSPKRRNVKNNPLQSSKIIQPEDSQPEHIRQSSRFKSSDHNTVLRTSARIAAQHLDHTVRTEELKPSNELDLDMDIKCSTNILQNFLTTLTVFMLITMAPIFILWITLSCKNKGFIFDLSEFTKKLSQNWNWKTVIVYIVWIAFQSLLACLPYGKLTQGQFVKDEIQLEYRLNGIVNLVITTSLTLATLYAGISFDPVFNQFTTLIMISSFLSYVFSFYLYMKASKNPNNEIGNTGNFMIDYFWGRELNPRIFNLDLKLLFNGRFGLLSWVMLILGFVWNDVVHNGKIYPSLLLVASFQLLYIIHFLWNEEYLLTTWNFTSEGLGFVLVFGKLTFLPFASTLPLQYLSTFRPEVSTVNLIMISLLYALGYAVLQGSNVQKGKFRRNMFSSRVKSLKVIETGKKDKLLADGWWSHVRHPNYLGDLIVTLAWCLPCGFGHVLPYTYLIYLLVILIQRVYRVEHKCKRKYGASWEVYCEQVKYKIVPYVF